MSMKNDCIAVYTFSPILTQAEKMNQPTMFSNGLEMGNFLVGSGLLHHSWAKIVDLQNEKHSSEPNVPLAIRHKVYRQTEVGTIIVFDSSPPCTIQHFHKDLVSPEDLKLNFPTFDFIGTKRCPSFSVNKAVIHLYASIQNELFLLNEYIDTRPLIITGHSIGGSIASLFTLWLLENMSPKANTRPLCITFGSPLLGDSCFQHAILERPTWNPSFLHFVSFQDPIPHIFTGIYRPFGTFLFCSDSGCAFFEEPDSIFSLMVKNTTVDFANSDINVVNYGNVLEKLKLGTLVRGVSELVECDSSPLRAGTTIQINAIGERWQVNGGQADSTIEEIEKKMKGLLNSRKKVSDPKKKLNDMKTNMAYIEWFKKRSVSNGGYYDTFKNTRSKSREDIVKYKNKLTIYWIKMVEEVEKLPKKEGTSIGTACLYGGTNYRRMVEPLDIAEWYKKGKTDYLAKRSEHYTILEKWMKDDQKKRNNIKVKACSLTEDSCFWAQVEEALVKCQLLSGLGANSVENTEILVNDLVRFENYVMDLIENYNVSTEIFLKQSSFMRWWENYMKVKGKKYSSSLTDFMRNHKYKEYV